MIPSLAVLLVISTACAPETLSIRPAWTLDFASGTFTMRNPMPIGVVRTNAAIRSDSVVLFDSAGRILKSIPRPDGTRVAVSRTGLVQAFYKEYGSFIDIRRNDRPPERLRSESYPVLSGDGRSLLLVTGEAEGMTLRSLEDGRQSDPVTPGQLIMDIAVSDDRFGVGLINGDLLLIDREILSTNASSSRRIRKVGQNAELIPMVKKIVFSPDGRLIACRHGHHPESISIYSVLPFRPVRRIRTGGSQRTKCVLSFSPKSRKLLSESPGGFRIYSTLTGRQLLSCEPPDWRTKRFFSCGWMGENRVVVSMNLEGRTFLGVIDMEGKVLWQTNLDEAWSKVSDCGPDRFVCSSSNSAHGWFVPSRGGLR